VKLGIRDLFFNLLKRHICQACQGTGGTPASVKNGKYTIYTSLFQKQTFRARGKRERERERKKASDVFDDASARAKREWEKCMGRDRE